MANLDSLSIDQQYALKLAATTLHEEFADFFSTETIQLYLETSYDQFSDRVSSPDLGAVSLDPETLRAQKPT